MAVRLSIHALEILPGSPGPKLQMVKQQLVRKIYIFLTNAAADVVKAVVAKNEELNKVTKEQELLIASLAAIQWQELMNSVITDLYEAVQIGGSDGIAQTELKEFNLESLASTYSSKRSAEMIGKKVVDGVLEDNPNARYVISNTTKDDLEDLIARAVENDISIDGLVKQIQFATTFSRTRAELIAKTEIAMAQIHGHLEMWKSSGVVKKVNIVLSSDHILEDMCDVVSKQSPFAIDELPSMPIHPNCECSVEAVETE